MVKPLAASAEPGLSEARPRGPRAGSPLGVVDATGSGDKFEDRRTTYAVHLEKLRKGLEKSWDGDWYRRGFYDDGTPLGSAESQECRIDSIAQSWAALSGAGDPARTLEAASRYAERLRR